VRDNMRRYLWAPRSNTSSEHRTGRCKALENL
jgi:hypothetical protein